MESSLPSTPFFQVGNRYHRHTRDPDLTPGHGSTGGTDRRTWVLASVLVYSSVLLCSSLPEASCMKTTPRAGNIRLCSLKKKISSHKQLTAVEQEVLGKAPLLAVLLFLLSLPVTTQQQKRNRGLAQHPLVLLVSGSCPFPAHSQRCNTKGQFPHRAWEHSYYSDRVKRSDSNRISTSSCFHKYLTCSISI